VRVLLRAVSGGALLCVVVLIAVLWAALERAPSIAAAQQVSAQTAERSFRRLAGHDPRRLQAGEQRTLTLDADMLRALLQAAARRLPDTRADAMPGDGSLLIRTSTQLPAGRWLNAELRLGETDGDARIEGLRIGSLDVPAALARHIARSVAPLLLQRLGYAGDPATITDTVRGTHMTARAVSIDYAASAQAVSDGVRALLPAGEAGRLAAYHDALGQAVDAQRARGDHDVLPVLQQLFALAAQRSENGGDRLAEQRSAVLALALYVNGRSPSVLLPDAAVRRIAPHALTLRGREDLVQHYSGSALLALYAGTQWADAIGLQKEMSDAVSGSGFSFTDLLADRAGTRLGETIAGGGDVATRFAAGLRVDQVLPPLAGLAEFMPDAEFRRRFGGVGAPAYQAVIDDIEARIGALDLYQ
jgi:hypothetical protein